MSSPKREIAKFACGFETFHAHFHAFLWFSPAPFVVFGFVLSIKLNVIATLVSGTLALALGRYAWSRHEDTYE